jgi:hypothetical protein
MSVLAEVNAYSKEFPHEHQVFFPPIQNLQKPHGISFSFSTKLDELKFDLILAETCT